MGTSESVRHHWLRPHLKEAKNLLRFDRFMELCLYDEANGYYARNISSVGKGGDFSTTPSLSPLLADSLARSILDSGLRDVIEIGPGAGDLACRLLRKLRHPVFLFASESAITSWNAQTLCRGSSKNESVAPQNFIPK